jgi:hypothetical protein
MVNLYVGITDYAWCVELEQKKLTRLQCLDRTRCCLVAISVCAA